MAHQPAISFSISFQHPFNRAGGRTSSVRHKIEDTEMHYLDDHRQQTVIGLFQAGAIVVGSFLTGAIMKGKGYSDDQEISFLVLFVRNWGFSLIIIPFAWVLATVWMERHHTWYSKRYTLLSGLLLLGLLCWFLIYVAARAGSVLVRMGN